MLSGRKANNSKLARKAVNNNNNSDYHDYNARHMTEQYQLVVEEIKAENKILGSLQMQQEVMKRLNERRGGDDSVVADGSIDLNENNDNTTQRRKTRAHNNFMQSFASSMHKSLGSLGDAFKHLEDELNVLRKSDNGNNNSNSDQVMPGRRESAAIPIGYDQTIIAAQVMQDLDLSDSDDSSHDINEVFNGSESNRTSFSRKNKRPSILRRGSSRIKGVMGRRISIKRRTSSVSFGGSSSGGGGTTEEEGGGEDNKKKQNISSLTTEEVEQIEHLAALGCKSGNNEQSTSSSSDAFEKTTTRDEDGDNDDKSTKKKDVTPDRITTPTNSSGSSSPKRQQQPHRRTGRRRSSLFSVDEKRASITGGITGGPPTTNNAGYNNSSVDGQSSSFSSDVNNSITEESLQGSFSSKEVGVDYKNESLICSFGRMYSMDSSPGAGADDGTLICDWERRQSMLSNSGTSILSNSGVLSIQDDMALLNTNSNHHSHVGKVKDDSSLICGWDKGRHSTLSITSDVSIPKDVTIGEISSEIQLQAAKESCTLFNVR